MGEVSAAVMVVLRRAAAVDATLRRALAAAVAPQPGYQQVQSVFLFLLLVVGIRITFIIRIC